MVMVRQGVLTRADVEAVEAIARSGEILARTIERYDVITKLGEGGMGSVYAVLDPQTGELCALKALPDELAADEDLVKRFQREGETACGLRHPNIVGGLRLGEFEGQHFFVMEFVDGETVYDRLERDSVIPEPEALKIVRGICLGLQYAEEKGLVHRDIKPENIMIDRDGTAKLLDMGLVKRLDASRVSRLTQSGMAIGTPHYISPEQARGEDNVDHRSDLYALGATLYHMITGKVPFEGSTAAVIMTKHLTEELDWPADVNSEISEHTSRLISKMMAKERRDRYEHARDAVDDIDLILSGRAPSGDLLPPGASSIRQAVRLARARERAAQRERTRKHITAVHERISRRRGNALYKLLAQLVQRHRQTVYYAAGAAGGLLLVVIAVIAGGSGRDHEVAMHPPPLVPVLRAPDPLEMSIEQLREARIEEIPSLLEQLPEARDLEPERAALVAEARQAAIARLDREGERRLNAILAATVQGGRTKEDALAELRTLRAAFAIGRVSTRIETAISALELPAPAHAAIHAAVGPVSDRPAVRAFPPVQLIDAHGLRGWRSYGEWQADGGALEFTFDERNRYSKAIQSLIGAGECHLSAEIRTRGGTRAEVAVWEQGTEDRESGAPDSSVIVFLTDQDLGPARDAWARLEIAADISGVTATLAGRPVKVVRSGSLHHGRIRFSLEGGSWSLRSIELVPLLPERDSVYEVAFDQGQGRDWSGRQATSGLAAVRAPRAPMIWADLPAGSDVFEISEGMRMGLVYRADNVSSLEARLLLKGGRSVSFRLSGRPPSDRWTALTIPVSNFRSADGRPPAPGSTVRGISIGANGPADASLVLSLLRFVR